MEEKIEKITDVMDYILSDRQRRHLTGGLLLSVSFLFGGVALTIMTLKESEKNG